MVEIAAARGALSMGKLTLVPKEKRGVAYFEQQAENVVKMARILPEYGFPANVFSILHCYPAFSPLSGRAQTIGINTNIHQVPDSKAANRDKLQDAP
jgi:hypothetical protein